MSLISDALKEAQKKRDELSSDPLEKNFINKKSGAKNFIIVSSISLLIVIISLVYFFINAEKKLQKLKKIETQNYLIPKKVFPQTKTNLMIKSEPKYKNKKKPENNQRKREKKKMAVPFPLKKENKSIKKTKIKEKKIDNSKMEQKISWNGMTIKKVKKGKTNDKIFVNKDYYLSKAEKALKQGLLDKAIKNYTLALSYSPEDTKILFNLGTAYLLKKQYLYALNEFEKILNKEPTNKKTLFNAGISLLKIGKVEKAKLLWEKLYSIEPDYPDIHYFLGIAEDFTKNYEAAKKHYFYYLSKGKNIKLKIWIKNRLKKLN